ncbi:MAG: response regulator [Bacteroidota bacterium]
MTNNQDKQKKYNWESKIILIVEDDICNACYIKEILDKTKAECKIAPNARMALKYFYSTPKIDLILMDLQLPDISGIELTVKIKAINSEVPIIAQTAFEKEFAKAKCLEVGCNDYITKPINKDSLLELIDSYFSDVHVK